MNIAIVGVTGKVGRTFVQVLQERNIKADNFYCFASARSAGTKVKLFDKEYEVIELTEENVNKYQIDYALFSAGGSISLEFAPIFAKNGAIVIDNSSAFSKQSILQKRYKNPSRWYLLSTYFIS